MQDQEFRRGLLLGLCASGRKTFDSYGPKYQEAFRKTLEHASKSGILEISAIGKRMLKNFDPMFGTYEDAAAMLLDGMSGFILTFESPGMVRARFSFSAGDARMLLVGTPWAAEMRLLGEKMNEVL